MAAWGGIPAVYGTALALTALIRIPGWRRVDVVAASTLYGLAAAWASTSQLPWVHLVAPGAALLGGYWLSGPFFHRPQPALERWLLRIDGAVCATVGCRAWPWRAPRWMLESLELAYAADYLVVGGGVLLLWPLGVDAVIRYWTIFLGAELTCYAALPWIRTRPPRVVEPPGPMDLRDLYFRRLNFAVLHRASVHANTIPSGHVAGAVAAALAVMMYMPAAGAALLAVSALISLAAFVGRYHYFVDVVLGEVVGMAAAILL